MNSILMKSSDYNLLLLPDKFLCCIPAGPEQMALVVILRLFLTTSEWDSQKHPPVCLQAVFCIPQYAQLGLPSQWQATLFALSLINPSKELLLVYRKKGWSFLPAPMLLQVQGCTEDWSH